MSDPVVQQFVEALGRLESHRDVAAIAATFSDESEIGNVLTPEQFRGRAGAREFWAHYRAAFGEVRSTFRNLIVADGWAALEWTTEGTSADGQPLRYDGVSILEIDGDVITRFRAYFDAAALGRQMAER